MMTYEYDPVKSIIHLRASGVLVVDDPINYFRKIDEDPTFKPKAEERIYFTNLEDIAFTYRNIISIRDAFKQYGHGEKLSRGIFIVDSDLTFGMARMVISILEEVFDKFSIERTDLQQA